MHERYIKFELPQKEQKIWRYMDFTKFMSLLDKKELYFSRADKFSDKFEGTFPKANREMRDLTFEKDFGLLRGTSLTQSLNAMYKKYREYVFINCWHMNEYESAAMWDLYVGGSEGIAIQSSFDRLEKAIEDCPQKIRFGKVEYRDFNKAPVSIDNAIDMFIYKRKSFEHECELRAMHILPFVKNVAGWADLEAESPVEHGLGISCNIEILIEKIYISPTAPPWFEELVRSMCGKFNLVDCVFKSELSELPY
ncbi:hypothetical protein P4J00_28325 [Bacillus cereus]|nr:hypothetical protein [Bacillus cereus]